VSTKLKFSVLLILWAVAFLPVCPDLFWAWLNHSNNSHGILVPLISVYFIWQKREILRKVKISNSNLGAVVLIISMGMYLLSYAGAVAVISRAMIVFSLIGLVLFTLGKTIFKLLSFPVLFLIFMIPVPDSIVGVVALPLQLFVTNISSFIIHAFSIPVYQEGNMLYFTQTQLEIAEACSGIRSLVSLAMLSVIFAYMCDKGWVRKATLLASAIPLALFANIVRVSGTGVLAHFCGDKVARGFLHEFSGLAVFAFGFVVLFSEYSFLNRIGRKKI
jgi:exosortase